MVLNLYWYSMALRIDMLGGIDPKLQFTNALGKADPLAVSMILADLPMTRCIIFIYKFVAGKVETKYFYLFIFY